MKTKEIVQVLGIPRLTLHGWKTSKGKYKYYKKILYYGLISMTMEELELFVERAKRRMKEDGTDIPPFVLPS